MTNQEIKDYLYTDREFQYKGKNGAFCPVDKYVVGWNGSEDAFDNIDDAINFPCFDGKSIIEIWDEIYPQISYSGDIT